MEETVLLDTLCGADNNVHLATEQLLTMGFNKRDTPTPRVVLKKRDEAEEEEEKLRQLLQSQRRSVSSALPPRMRSLEEKQDSKFNSRSNAVSFFMVSSEVLCFPQKRMVSLFSLNGIEITSFFHRNNFFFPS